MRVEKYQMMGDFGLYPYSTFTLAERKSLKILGGGLDFWPFLFGFLAFFIGFLRWIPEALSAYCDGIRRGLALSGFGDGLQSLGRYLLVNCWQHCLKVPQKMCISSALL